MAEHSTRILIVEDDEFLRSLIARKLEGEKFTVVTAVDGESGLAAAGDKPDLILLDLLLPGISGFDVLKTLKEKDNLKHIPVIVFSNLGQREDIEKAKNLGVTDYLIKANFTLDDLVVKIKAHLGQK
jgi:DNA-binding response OmpR family regulator